MSIFDAQFGGVHLINTYQFNQGPGLPDISGYRGLLQGAAMPRAAAAQGTRQTTVSQDELPGLTGERRSYRMAQHALNTAREATVNKYFDLYQNQHRGIWEDFYQAHGEKMQNELLQFSAADMEMEAALHGMESNQSIFEELRKDPDVANNIALRKTPQGIEAFGLKRETGEIGWGHISQIGQFAQGQEAMYLIDRDAVFGTPALFPTKYDANKFTEEIDGYLTGLENNTVTRTWDQGGPTDRTDPYSMIRTAGGSTKQNTEAMRSLLSSTIDQISPEARMALTAQTISSVGTYVVGKDAQGNDIHKTGIPDYVVNVIQERNQAPRIEIGIRQDRNGNAIILDMEDPEQAERAISSQAKFLTAQKAGKHFMFEVSSEETLAFGRERPIATTGINTLAAEGAVPFPARQEFASFGLHTTDVQEDLERWGQRLGSTNRDLQNKYSEFLRSHIINDRELSGLINNAALTPEQRRAVGAKIIERLEGSKMFTEQEIMELMSGRVVAQGGNQRNIWQEAIAFIPERIIPFANIRVENGRQILTVDGNFRGNEIYHSTLHGLPISVHTDLSSNVNHYMVETSFMTKDNIRVAGMSDIYKATDLNSAGVIFIPNNDLYSVNFWANSSDKNDVVPAGGRGGYIVIPAKVAANTTTQMPGRDGVPRPVKRHTIVPIREIEKGHTMRLNSTQFDHMFATEPLAHAARAKFRELNPTAGEDPEVTFVSASAATINPIQIDLKGGQQFSVPRTQEIRTEAINFDIQQQRQVYTNLQQHLTRMGEGTQTHGLTGFQTINR